MILKILKAAEEDIVNGANFYDKQKKGLADYFVETIFSDIDSLHLYAGIHPTIRGYYRLLSKRFPYAISYKILNNDVLIYAVLDCRRNPSSLNKKLRRGKK